MLLARLYVVSGFRTLTSKYETYLRLSVQVCVVDFVSNINSNSRSDGEWPTVVVEVGVWDPNVSMTRLYSNTVMIVEVPSP